MKLVEDSVRARIHCDVINCLREEDTNITAHTAYSPDRCMV